MAAGHRELVDILLVEVAGVHTLHAGIEQADIAQQRYRAGALVALAASAAFLDRPNRRRAWIAGLLLALLCATRWASVVTAAAMIGAILSSFNSALNSSCTLFSLGLYKNVFNPEATEAQVVKSGKVFGWIVAVAAMVIAPMLAGQESIFGYLQKMNG